MPDFDERLQEAKIFTRDPEVRASAFMVVGSAVWRLVNHLSNVDFLLSFTGEKFSMLTSFLQNYAWLLVIAGGLLLIWQR